VGLFTTSQGIGMSIEPYHHMESLDLVNRVYYFFPPTFPLPSAIAHGFCTSTNSTVLRQPDPTRAVGGRAPCLSPRNVTLYNMSHVLVTQLLPISPIISSPLCTSLIQSDKRYLHFLFLPHRHRHRHLHFLAVLDSFWNSRQRHSPGFYLWLYL
jgi:hypothetical protein